MSPDVLRIFVSSPGDVGEERVMTERVVQRLQGEFGQSIKLEAVLWEHEPMRATQHPQEQIPLPSECDIVVCLLWSRLGTRLPDQISATGKTGTEWEFEEAARSFQAKKTPDLLVYHKKKEVLENVRDRAKNEERSRQMEALDGFLDRWFMSADGTFKAVFKTFQELDQFEDLLEKDLRKLIQERLKLTPIGEKTWHDAPFRGLEVFDFEHAPIFFGRTRAIGAIREALAQQAAHGCAFVMVFGMSGVGKSSLVRAGVLPTITQPGVIEGVGLWRWCVFRPSDATGDLFDGLASALMAAQALPELAEAGVDARALAKLLREAPEQAALPLSVGLKRAAETTAAAERLRKPPVTRLALLVDQMEELFSSDRVSEPQRIGFVQALSALARSGHVWIIGTMRSDFYPRCADLPELAALKAGTGQFDLLPPTAPQLAQMIGDPARAAGLRFEEKVTGERLDHVLQETALRDPQALPLLEFTLAELYKLCSKDKMPGEAVVLTFAAYDQLGGMEGALARRAEEEFARLPANVQAALPAVFRALVTVRQGEDEAIVAQPVLREVFAAVADQEALVEAFIQARLFVSDRTSLEQKAMVRLAHEALLRCWPRLVQWLGANREFLRIRARVSEEANRWQSEGRLPELLLHGGKPLAEGEFLLKQQRQELDPDVVEYIELSRQIEARTRRRRQVVVTAFVFSLVIGSVVSVYFAWESDQNANKAIENAALEKKARKKADENAALEEKARKEADDSAALEKKARKEADESAKANKLLAQEEAFARKKAEFVAYASHLREARERIAAGRLTQAADILNQQDSRFQGWEHAFLLRQTRRGLWTVAKHAGWVKSVAFSRDGKRVVSGSFDLLGKKPGEMRVWDAITGEELLTLKGITSGVQCVDFSHDGTRLAAGTGDISGRPGEVTVWNAATGEVERTLQGHKKLVNGVAFSPDGKRLASASWDNSLKMWDAITGKELFTLEGHNKGVLSVAFNHDGKRVISGSDDRTVKVWDAATGKELLSLKGHTASVQCVAISRDDKHIASAGSGNAEVRLWDAATGRELQTLDSDSRGITSVTFSSDGKRLVTGSIDQTVKVWDVQTGREALTLMGHRGFVFCVAFSPDGKRIVSGSGDPTGQSPGEVKVWDVAVGQESLTIKGHVDIVWSVAFNRDGKRLATASGHLFGAKPGEVKVWDTATGLQTLTLKGHLVGVWSVAFSPDGKRLATGSGSLSGDIPEVKLWDAATGELASTLKGHNGPVWSVAFSPDGHHLIAGGGDQFGAVAEVRRWDPATGTEAPALKGHKGLLKCVAFSADGKYIASASGGGLARLPGEIKVWEAATGRETLSLKGLTGAGNGVAFSPNGKRIVSGGGKSGGPGELKVWDLVTGQVALTLHGHTNSVLCVAFSPDGKRIASGSTDHTVKVWDAETGMEALALKGHTGEVNSVTFSADGKRIASASGDPLGATPAEVRVWDASPAVPR